MSDLIEVVQEQEIGESLIHLFELSINGTTIYAYSGLDDGSNPIYFPALNSSDGINEYVALPMEIEGVEWASNGAQARPTLTIANIISFIGNSDETTLGAELESLNITYNEDILGSRLVFRRTLGKYLAAPGDTWTTPVEFPVQSYVLDRIAGENNVTVSFELASPFDVEGIQIPNRVVVGKYCPWKYQGHFLGLGSGCTWPLNSDERFYDINDNLITFPSIWVSGTSYTTGEKVHTNRNNHTKIWQAIRPSVGKHPEDNRAYWVRVDVCGKTLSACKVRFQKNGDTSVVLPFGGFPGTRKFK